MRQAPSVRLMMSPMSTALPVRRLTNSGRIVVVLANTRPTPNKVDSPMKARALRRTCCDGEEVLKAGPSVWVDEAKRYAVWHSEKRSAGRRDSDPTPKNQQIGTSFP